MATNDYHFVSNWQVDGTQEEVFDILGDATDLVRRWPAVYLDVKQLEPGGAQGIGRWVRLSTKGWLPDTRRWEFVVTDVQRPRGVSLAASGDFVGQGRWTFTHDGPRVAVVDDWLMRADKPLLRDGSFFMTPIFAAHHRWAMARGEESLRRELRRRQARSPDERSRVPAPPGPTWPSARPAGAERGPAPRALVELA